IESRARKRIRRQLHDPFRPKDAGKPEQNHQSRDKQRNRFHVVAPISSENFFKSIFPPDTIATIGPSPALPVNAAASGNAPAPSAITRAFSAIKRIAAFVSSRVTTM